MFAVHWNSTLSAIVLFLCALGVNAGNNRTNRSTSSTLQNYRTTFRNSSHGLQNLSLVTEMVLARRNLSTFNETESIRNSSAPRNENKYNTISLAEIYRYRVLVSGYLILSVVAIGLLFLVVTHFLGKMQLRRSQLNSNGPYRSFTKWELQHL